MKKANATFDVATGKRVLQNVNNVETKKGKVKMATKENGENGETKADRRALVEFLDSKGNVAKTPQEGCVKVRVTAKEVGQTVEIDVAALAAKYPDLVMRAAAQGFSVHLRNQINTADRDDPEAGAEALVARAEGFNNGVYRSLATANAMPLIILALKRALEKGGKSAEEVTAKVDAYLAEYNAGEDDEAQKKSRKAVTDKLGNNTLVKAARIEIERERLEARAKKNAATETASIDDL